MDAKLFPLCASFSFSFSLRFCPFEEHRCSSLIARALLSPIDMSSSLSSRASISSTTTSFHSSRQLAATSPGPGPASVSRSSLGTSRRPFVVSNAAQISFVRDSVETCVPDVKLTKSRDGTSGTAFFTFENPDVFEGASGDITGMYMADEEGEMTTVRGRL